MKYYTRSRTFKCKCGRTGYTIKDDVTECGRCRSAALKCINCGNKFHSTVGKVSCRKCNNLSKNLSRTYSDTKTKKMIKSNCDDYKQYETDIRLLYVKLKHNLLSQIDIFRVVNIYISVTCNEASYSTFTPEDQCACMLNDLMNMVTSVDEVKTKGRKGRAVVKINEEGDVIAEYASVTEAAKSHDIYKGYVTNSCNLKHKKHCQKSGLRFRWKVLFNI